MATAVVPTSRTRATPVAPIRHMVIGWLLVFPLVFYAVGGIFSFEGDGEPNDRRIVSGWSGLRLAITLASWDT